MHCRYSVVCSPDCELVQGTGENMTAHLHRTSSVCPDPKTALLNAVRQNADFEDLIRKDVGLLSTIFESYNKPILHVACYDFAAEVTAETVEKLIDLGADLHFSDARWSGKQALHFATLGQNPHILKKVIERVGPQGINATSNGRTALVLLIVEGSPDSKHFETCAKILLEAGIDPNKTNIKGVPPIYLAAKEKQENIVGLLLQNNNIDLDSYQDRKGKTARALIKESGCDVSARPVYTQTLGKSDTLYECLKKGDESEFLRLAIDSDLDDSSLETTFLQKATKKNLVKVVEYLLHHDKDPNAVNPRNTETPLSIAASHGYHDIFEILIKHPMIRINTNVLSKILQFYDNDSNHSRCYDALLSSEHFKDIDMNVPDSSGNYPLHYGARFGGSKIALDLLNRKASLANKSKFGILTISDVDHDTLKEHFDSCIDAQPINQLDRESMTITFDYETLMPTRKSILSGTDVEKNSFKEYKTLVPETEAILLMSKSQELKSLLIHPLIVSFLFMKWHKMRWIFYGNLILYLTFCLSLLLYGISYYKEESVPWFFWLFLFLTTIILSTREVFQVLVSPKKYAMNFENYIEVSLIIVTLLMLFSPLASTKMRVQLCALVFLLAAFELLFFMGNYPALSTNIVMLRTVSSNFFKFLAFYCIPIIAFAFCFHTLFNEHHETISATKSNETDEENNEFFVNPYISLFKTLVMSTGEYEAGELRFDLYPVTSHLIFATFVITIAVILLNLLNGLAVSDTQEIRSQAKLIGYIARAEYISHAESMIFSSKVPNFILDIFSCLRPGSRSSMSKSLQRTISLYSNYMDDSKLVVYPHQGGKLKIERNLHCKCAGICLDEKTINAARLLIDEKIEKRRRREEDEKFESRLIAIEESLRELTDLIKSSAK